MRCKRRPKSNERCLELRETENQHKDALDELNRMKETMEKMEHERSEMIAEVEAQIERALESMAVDIDESEYGSRPSSRLSSRSAPGTLRRSSSSRANRPLRSFSTESTLTESYREDGLSKHPHRASTVPEVDEPEEDVELTAAKTKRFSATRPEQDGMTAVDEGISQKTDTIAQKVLQIQRKVR